jgi:hypothetical protein
MAEIIATRHESIPPGRITTRLGYCALCTDHRACDVAGCESIFKALAAPTQNEALMGIDGVVPTA